MAEFSGQFKQPPPPKPRKKKATKPKVVKPASSERDSVTVIAEKLRSLPPGWYYKEDLILNHGLTRAQLGKAKRSTTRAELNFRGEDDKIQVRLAASKASTNLLADFVDPNRKRAAGNPTSELLPYSKKVKAGTALGTSLDASESNQPPRKKIKTNSTATNPLCSQGGSSGTPITIGSDSDDEKNGEVVAEKKQGKGKARELDSSREIELPPTSDRQDSPALEEQEHLEDLRRLKKGVAASLGHQDYEPDLPIASTSKSGIPSSSSSSKITSPGATNDRSYKFSWESTSSGSSSGSQSKSKNASLDSQTRSMGSSSKSSSKSAGDDVSSDKGSDLKPSLRMEIAAMGDSESSDEEVEIFSSSAYSVNKGGRSKTTTSPPTSTSRSNIKNDAPLSLSAKKPGCTPDYSILDPPSNLSTSGTKSNKVSPSGARASASKSSSNLKGGSNAISAVDVTAPGSSSNLIPGSNRVVESTSDIDQTRSGAGSSSHQLDDEMEDSSLKKDYGREGSVQKSKTQPQPESDSHLASIFRKGASKGNTKPKSAAKNKSSTSKANTSSTSKANPLSSTKKTKKTKKRKISSETLKAGPGITPLTKGRKLGQRGYKGEIPEGEKLDSSTLPVFLP